MAAYSWVYDNTCLTVGLVGDGGSPQRVHEYACCYLQADCIVPGSAL